LIHYDASAASQSDVDAAKRSSTARQMNAVRKNVTFTTTPTASSATVESSPAILPHTSVESKPQRNGHRSSIEGQNTLNATNFKYLKHVLLKFMTSTEDEVSLSIGKGKINRIEFLGYSSYSCRINFAQFLRR
jgi:hypothetical protein